MLSCDPCAILSKYELLSYLMACILLQAKRTFDVWKLLGASARSPSAGAF